MCEQFVARATEPFAIAELWSMTERLERHGLAGYGWGAAWTTGDARASLGSHRDVRAFADDPAGREAVGRRRTTALLVHLRRPSRLSTLGLADTQPFLDPDGRFAFSHNGDLRDWRTARRAYLEQGRIEGRADSEVGARWLEDAWTGGGDTADDSAADLLAALHGRFGGRANLAVLAADGTATVYAGNDENPVFRFRLGRIEVVSTGVYSLDRSLFGYVARGATDRRVVRVGGAATLSAGPGAPTG
jgi:hypothetical protein